MLALLCLCAVVPGQGRTVRDFFASEPDDIFLLVPHTARLDLLDYYDSGQRVEMTSDMDQMQVLNKVLKADMQNIRDPRILSDRDQI